MMCIAFTVGAMANSKANTIVAFNRIFSRFVIFSPLLFTAFLKYFQAPQNRKAVCSIHPVISP